MPQRAKLSSQASVNAPDSDSLRGKERRNIRDQGGITIREGTLIGHNVALAALNHDMAPEHRKNLHLAPIKVGRHIWIGANATVCPGVTIEGGAVVAAGAVVTKDAPANMVVGGVAAKVIRYTKGAARSA